jgi:small subunit ribosomal protein S8
MSQTDPIADMLTRIRNANKALHAQVEMPASSQKVTCPGSAGQGYIARLIVVRAPASTSR